MKRILIVVESLFPLGPAQQLTYLASQLAERDYDVHVAALQFRECDLADLADSQFEVHGLGEKVVNQPLARSSFQSIFQLRKLIRSLGPDIVHAWCGMAEFVTVAAMQFNRTPKRSKRIRRIATKLYLHPTKPLTRQWFENRHRPGFDKIAVSHELIKKQLANEGYEEDRIVVIPNSASAEVLERTACRNVILSELGLPEDTKFAGTVAPLVPRNRLKDLVWACDLLNVIRDDFHFLVIGEGAQRDRLKRFASLTAAGPQCHFLGEHPQAKQILAGLDFYWHSHLNEPLPGNLLTAMANQVPAIAVYGPGTSEIIRHQETGFAVNFGARDEFARWTKYLIELREPADKLARQGQSFVQQHFTGRSFVDQYLGLYSSD